ncbi:helix-turn-helix domain-containing protein [Actinoplanes sp. NPDC049316]|uniref:helix-turn-helix transcriptional regulator n=1 Tax=Actinoplanes sp. NPDC049316 TaxID=3154727 RepID=UPI00341924C6
MSDDVTYDALAVPSRRQLLATLKAADGGLDAAALAAATGLHANTVRFHLDLLVRAGMVEQHNERGRGRGRPRLVYTATGAGEDGGGYRLLAEMIVSHLDQAGPAVAEDAGRAWARRFAPPEQPAAAAEPAAATGQVVTAFTTMGFEPRAAVDDRRARVDLHACPFRGIARRHPNVVCTMHRGLLRGLIDQHGAGHLEADLTPFVEPDLCVAHISTTATGGPAPLQS